jgi:PAS domain S-box-containing protein
LRYGVAIASVVLALLSKLALEPLIVQETPFLLVFAAVIVSAWYGGLGPGLLATVTAGLATDYFFLPPVNAFSGFGGETIPLVLYTLEGLLINGIVVGLRHARQRAEASTREAESHQEQLRQSEERYRVVAETASDAIFMIDADSEILFVNSAAEKIFGYAGDEMLGERLTMLIPEHLREAHQASLKRYVDTGRQRLDWNSIDLPGCIRAAERSPWRSPFGEVVKEGEHFFTGFVRDVTERRRAEEALRASEERFRLMVEGVKDYAIFMLDADGYIVSWNAGAERIKDIGQRRS